MWGAPMWSLLAPSSRLGLDVRVNVREFPLSPCLPVVQDCKITVRLLCPPESPS